MEQRQWLYRWDDVYGFCQDLVKQIKPIRKKIHTIKAVAMGGIIPAGILSYHLNLDLKIMDYPPTDADQSGALLFDDVCDTGETFEDYVGDDFYKWEATAALVTKPHCRKPPTYTAAVTDYWVIFPWETDTRTAEDRYRQQATEECDEELFKQLRWFLSKG